MSGLRLHARAVVREAIDEAVVLRLREMPPRVLAALVVGYPRELAALVRQRLDVLLALPGDCFEWFIGDLVLEVAVVPRPGHPILRPVADHRGRPRVFPLSSQYRVAWEQEPFGWPVIRPSDLERLR